GSGPGGRGVVNQVGKPPLILAHVFANHQLQRPGSCFPIDVPHVIRRVIASYPVQIVAVASCVTLDLSSQHRKRVIKIPDRLRLRVNQNLSICVDSPPLLEKAGWKLGCDAKAGYWVPASSRECMLQPDPTACLSRYQHKVRELSESARTGPKTRRSRMAGSLRCSGCNFVLTVGLLQIACVRERLYHQTVAGHKSFMIYHRRGNSGGLAGKNVIGEPQ